ncbi:MAG: hypothetical protein WC548_01695 [Candidatus Pacearchaeota archaeon]
MRRKGFAWFEIVIVAVILAILAMITIPQFQNAVREGKEHQAQYEQLTEMASRLNDSVAKNPALEDKIVEKLAGNSTTRLHIVIENKKVVEPGVMQKLVISVVRGDGSKWEISQDRLKKLHALISE